MTTLSGSAGTDRGATESLAAYAYRTLRDQLVLLDIQPGDPIVESRLAPELGVGRTPLREALKRLESDHLVVTFARRGTFAANVDLTELSDISEMRHALVPLAARNAAQHRGGTVREHLMEARNSLAALPGSGRANTRRELLTHDLRIHRLINAASGNAYLEETLARLDDLVTRMWCLVLERLPPMAEHVEEHDGIIGAILEGRSERAESLALSHVRHFDHVVRTVL